MIIFLRYANSEAVIKALKTMLVETFDPAETAAIAETIQEIEQQKQIREAKGEKFGRSPW